MNKTFSILFVCSGNSCRSPMAEGLMRLKIPEALRPHVLVASAGTLGINGAPATDYAIQVAGELGADISAHRSQGITEELVRNADVVFCMSYEHRDYLISRFPERQENIFLLRTFGRGSEEVEDDSIDDPIGGSLQRYRECCELIETELTRVWPRLQGLIESKLSSGLREGD